MQVGVEPVLQEALVEVGHLAGQPWEEVEGVELGHSAAPVVEEVGQLNIQELPSERSVGCQEVGVPPSSSKQWKINDTCNFI